MLLDYLKFYTKPGITQIERRILHLIKYSYDTIPFYKALLDKNGLKPSDFNNLQDFISYFPRTTSNEYRTIQQDNDPYFLINKQYELSELFLDQLNFFDLYWIIDIGALIDYIDSLLIYMK